MWSIGSLEWRPQDSSLRFCLLCSPAGLSRVRDRIRNQLGKKKKERNQLGAGILGLGRQTDPRTLPNPTPYLLPGKQSWIMSQQPLRGVTSLRFNQDQSERDLCLYPCGREGEREGENGQRWLLSSPSFPPRNVLRQPGFLPFPRLLLLCHGDRRAHLQCGALDGEGASG